MGSDPKSDNSMFYLNLLWCLMALGQQRGVEMVPVIDQRPGPMRVLEPAEVARIRKAGEADGLIGFVLYPAMTTWMKETGLPWSVFCEGRDDHHVQLDLTGMIRNSLVRLKELGCKTAGFMLPPGMCDSLFLEEVDAVSTELDITVNYEWIIVSSMDQEQSGMDQLNALWKLKKRPEGLVVFPDRLARGVVSAILEKHIRVPSELRLILHRNAESPYIVPVPCDWIEVRVNEIATALMDNLGMRWEGRPVAAKPTQLHLIKGLD
jgi:DNA-binding LacI/PurR family transcriptional regulator